MKVRHWSDAWETFSILIIWSNHVQWIFSPFACEAISLLKAVTMVGHMGRHLGGGRWVGLFRRVSFGVHFEFFPLPSSNICLWTCNFFLSLFSDTSVWRTPHFFTYKCFSLGGWLRIFYTLRKLCGTTILRFAAHLKGWIQQVEVWEQLIKPWSWCSWSWWLAML